MKRMMFIVLIGLVACGTNTHKTPALRTNAIKKDSIKIVEVKQDASLKKEKVAMLTKPVCDFGKNIQFIDEDSHKQPIKDIDTMKIDDSELLIDPVEEMPQFPGGDSALLRFIEKNLKYPNTDACVQGRVILRFVVTKNGSVEKIEIIRSLDPVFDKEAIRVVKLFPKFIPGKQNGQNVDVWYTLPITFKME